MFGKMFIYYKLQLLRKKRLKLHDSTVHIAGWGTRFEFGDIKEDTWEDPIPEIASFTNPSTYSSCMTTAESPKHSRFKYCDTKDARTPLLASLIKYQFSIIYNCPTKYVVTK